jgi:ribosomal protein L32
MASVKCPNCGQNFETTMRRTAEEARAEHLTKCNP